ncbi:hypothetical protein [Variovorax soli]|uniref:Uncharacterized protein n=1 Tax=Variovorax soli TaxID=376815 RepID=A0ABU1NC18_9BURK|nr:hypothetical protein [Variovorax soli]MDR6535590.1 hypothetical protein [Variovorax soli]
MTTAVDQKRLATLTATAALAGIILHHTEGDFVPNIFIVSRWALTREFTDLDAVEAWLDLVTGKKVA